MSAIQPDMYLGFRLIEWEFCILVLPHAQYAGRFTHNSLHGFKTRNTCGIRWNSRNMVESAMLVTKNLVTNQLPYNLVSKVRFSWMLNSFERLEKISSLGKGPKAKATNNLD